MDDRLENIETQLVSIKEMLYILNDKMDFLTNKINVKETVDNELLEECKKMGTHIDFIENVYDNVKHPLGFICNKMKYLAGYKKEIYTLTDISNN